MNESPTADSPTEDPDITQPEDQSDPKSGSRISRVLGIVALAVALLGLALYLIDASLEPDIPEELTKGTEIKTGDPANQKTLNANSITAKLDQKKIDEAEHPLDPLLELARQLLERYDQQVTDYVAVMQKQVRIDGELGPEGFMTCKVREPNKEKEIPFSVYTYFLKPKKLAGQEAIWVKGRDADMLIAHAHGLQNVVTAWLAPDSDRAMEGNLHPIYLLGMRNLIAQMLVKGKRDRKHEECSVSLTRNVDVGGHQCTLIEINHPIPREHFEFHIARIYIDDQRELPIAYEAFLWPEKEGDQPPLLEKYYYNDIQLNQGLTDEDFSHRNPAYNYPRFELFKPTAEPKQEEQQKN